MDLRCSKCGSDTLKKVSLACQEGLQNVNARARIRGVVVGADGPDLIVGGAITKSPRKFVPKALMFAVYQPRRARSRFGFRVPGGGPSR